MQTRFPTILQTQEGQVQCTSFGDTACPGAGAREGATKDCTKACPAPALPLPSCAIAATPPFCHTFEKWAGSALPSASVPQVGPELHVEYADAVTRLRSGLGQLSQVRVSPKSGQNCMLNMQTPSHVRGVGWVSQLSQVQVSPESGQNCMSTV